MNDYEIGAAAVILAILATVIILHFILKVPF
jgi:hypothetical protein